VLKGIDMRTHLGKLKYNNKSEEGEIELSPLFPKDVVGLDVLQDWILLLAREYDALLQETFKKKENQNANNT
jgi:hypothetical protein